MAEYIEHESQLRKDCPMRHENGNCLPSGGFCTAVNAPICAAMHNAYYMGKTYPYCSNYGAKMDGKYINITTKTDLPDDIRQNILNTFMKGSED